MMHHKILLVDDDRDLLEMLLSIFRRAGYTKLLTASSGPEALRVWKENQPDLIVLDVMMPGMDGFSVLKEIRRTSRVPVLMLTARGEAEDRIEGLEIGADDYLPKPFHLAELSARIRSVMRRHRQQGRRYLEAGNVRLWPESRRVEIAGNDVELLRKEYDILHYFMARPNHTIDKAALAEGVWGDHIDQADNFDFVYAQMKNLRRKLEQAGAEIRAVYGFGYKLVRP